MARYAISTTDATATAPIDAGAARLFSDRYFQNLLAKRRDRLSGLLDMDRDVLETIDAVLELIARGNEGSP